MLIIIISKLQYIVNQKPLQGEIVLNQQNQNDKTSTKFQ